MATVPDRATNGPVDRHIPSPDDAGMANSVVLVPSDTVNVSPREYFCIKCTVSGDVSVLLEAGTTHIIPVEADNVYYLPLAVKRVNVTGTTATATYENLWK